MAGIKEIPAVQKALAELGRDKKKAAILAVLVLVGLVLGIRMFAKVGPSKASATPLVTAQNSPTTDGKMDRDATDETKAKAKRDQYIKEMKGTITRDLFTPDLSLFPARPVEPVRVTPTTTSAPVAATTGPSPEELARQAAMLEARSFVLESTMIGQSSVASINGKVLHVGESLGGFEVVEITSRSCMVRKSGVTVTLEIRK